MKVNRGKVDISHVTPRLLNRVETHAELHEIRVSDRVKVKDLPNDKVCFGTVRYMGMDLEFTEDGTW